jgi:hypothetical protein
MEGYVAYRRMIINLSKMQVAKTSMEETSLDV